MSRNHPRAPQGDVRLTQDADTSTEADVRGSRSLEDFSRTNEDGTAISMEERSRMIRSEFTQEALPTVPTIPGYHCCWLSSTSSYDPIHKRMRLGYRPVKTNELPGFESFRMTSGEFEGCVSCNEMLLFKIPQEQYQAIMAEFHHMMPAEEEEALKSRLVKEDLTDSEDTPLGIVEGDGFEQLVSKRRARMFQ